MRASPAPSPRLSPREAAMRVLGRLRDAGHVAYFAGGCVRDALLGLEPKDYDIATDARPQQVQHLYPRARAVGEAFGVILVQLGGHPIEVATFRQEWGYTDGRHPDRVTFSDAEHDAQRRDFSLNGLFADPHAPAAPDEPCCSLGRVIDFVGGVADLRHGVIRAIGQPEERFAEDYLRMLRAVRFAARYDFPLDPATAAAIRATAHHLGQISRERIGAELKAMLLGPRPAQAAALLQALRLDGPTLQTEAYAGALPTLAALALTTLPADAPFPAALLAWMLDRHLPASSTQAVEPPASRLQALQHFGRDAAPPQIERWRRALTLSNDQRDHLRAAAGVLARLPDWPQLDKAARKRLLAAPGAATARAVFAALPWPEAASATTRLQQEAAPLEAEGLTPPPLLTGGELIRELGLRPSPLFGRLLEATYDAQLDGTVTTPPQALAWARHWLNSDDGRRAGETPAI